MIRYPLDDLGCLQFEWLIQSLLKAELSLAIESWGGRGDMGRDAFYADSLPFPLRQMPSSGPFLFQMKFVENANAAGAKSDHAVIDSVQKEVARIQERLTSRHKATRTAWTGLKHYVLYTNAPMRPALRTKIAEKVNKVLADVKVHAYGGGDVCDLLDRHPSVRRSFPQILGLRDLNELLRCAIDKKNIEFTRRVLDQARDVCLVFVPTAPYLRAWDVLREHSFAVLEGPPEMGKTAIAWIIALSQVSLGWDAVICSEPEDFFARFDETRSQIFVADDAFGRTEYDPGRGLKWENRLGLILSALDSKHWLLWTSRKQILERALRAMDLQLQSKRFPDPGAVLVDASLLSVPEKALMLYRHARSAKLDEGSRALVRFHARTIVHDEYFTPERIRLFVAEALPSFAGELASMQKLTSRIKEAIRNPTDRMRKSFLALPWSHKWFLISLLEVGDDNQSANVLAVYSEHCPNAERRPAEEVFQELKEAFVKGTNYVDWMHPSYRDLVIEELSRDESLKLAFLDRMGIPGIKLAVSDTGGALGTRSFPLMTSQDAWRLLTDRCLSVVQAGNASDAAELLNALESASRSTRSTEIRECLSEVLASVCVAACTKWNAEHTVLSHEHLRIYGSASTLARPLPPVPIVEQSWTAMDDKLTKALKLGTSLVFESEILRNWVSLAKTIGETEPRFLVQVGFFAKLKELVPKVLSHIRDELEALDRLGGYDELSHTEYSLSELAACLWELRRLSSSHGKAIHGVIGLVRTAKQQTADAAAEVAPPEEDDDDDHYRPRDSDFDIDALFEDL